MLQDRLGQPADRRDGRHRPMTTRHGSCQQEACQFATWRTANSRRFERSEQRTRRLQGKQDLSDSQAVVRGPSTIKRARKEGAAAGGSLTLELFEESAGVEAIDSRSVRVCGLRGVRISAPHTQQRGSKVPR
jgi:hypothetical protein